MTEGAAPATGTPAVTPTGAAPNTPTPTPTPTPNPTQQTFTTPWDNAQGVYKIGEGDAAKPWWSGINEEPIRQYMEEKNYANPYEAARAAWNANKLNKLTPDIEAFVNGKATPEQEAAVFKMLGRPETADKYEFKIPENTPVDQNLLKFGKELFFDLGLSPERSQKAFDKWQAFAAAQNASLAEADRKENDKAMTELETRWGGELEANRAAGNRAVHALGISNELIQKVEAAIGSAAIVELLAAIGKKSSEAGFKGPGEGGNSDPNNVAAMTPAQAQSRLRELQNDTAFQAKYTNKNAEGHAEAVRLMEQLFAKGG